MHERSLNVEPFRRPYWGENSWTWIPEEIRSTFTAAGVIFASKYDAQLAGPCLVGGALATTARRQLTPIINESAGNCGSDLGGVREGGKKELHEEAYY